MTRYYAVSQDEMEAVLFEQDFRKIEIKGTVELVYAKMVYVGDHKLSLRVFSGINPDGVSRGCGQDAIRVQAYWRYNNEIVPTGRSQKIKRIETWEKNLQKAIDRWEEGFGVCPRCGSPMVVRNGVNGAFYGCCTYRWTNCNGRPDPAPAPKAKPVTKPVPVKAATPTAATPTRPVNPYRIPSDKISEFQQASEVFFNTTGSHILHKARAGGGKTTLLRHLSSYRKPKEKAVYLAFNSRNAEEGREKLPKEVPSLTTHSFCKRMLSEAMTVPQNVTKGKTSVVMNEVYPTLNNKDRKRLRRAAVKLTGLCKNSAVMPGDAEAVKAVMEEYDFEVQSEAEKYEMIGVVAEVLTLSAPGGKYGTIWDFDDMLWWPVVLGLKPPRHDIVFADEVQDFNANQIWLMRGLVEGGARLISVGDDLQACYRFRGADASAFDLLHEMMSADRRGVTEVFLPVNYRSGRKIIEYAVANTVVTDIVAAPDAADGEVREDLSYEEIIDKLAAEYGQKE